MRALGWIIGLGLSLMLSAPPSYAGTPESYAAGLVELLEAGDVRRCGANVDVARALRRALRGAPVGESTAALTEELGGLLESPAVTFGPLARFVVAGGRISLLRAGRDEAGPWAILRRSSPSLGVGYTRLRLHEIEGRFGVTDIEDLAADVSLVENLRREAARRLRASGAELSGELARAAELGDALAQARERLSADGPDAALAALRELPEALREDAAVGRARLAIALLAEDELRIGAVAQQLRKAQGANPSLLLTLFDHACARERWEEARGLLAELDAAIGGDPYLKVAAAGLALREGRLELAATRLAESGAGAMPEYWRVALALSLRQKDHAATLAALTTLQDRFGLRFPPLGDALDYAEFVRSEAYGAWRAHRIDGEAEAQLGGMAPERLAEFAERLHGILGRGDGAALTSLVDLDGILARALADLPRAPQLAGIAKGLRDELARPSWLPSIAKWAQEGGGLAYVGVRLTGHPASGGRVWLVFRVLGPGYRPALYVEAAVGPMGEELRVLDWRLSPLFESLSVSAGRAARRALAELAPELRGALNAGAAVDEAEAVEVLEDLLMKGASEAALERYKALPEALRGGSRAVAQAGLLAATRVSDAARAEVLGAAREAFPGDIFIDVLTVNGELGDRPAEELEAACERVSGRVGSDPYLLVIAAIAFLEQRELEQAGQVLAAAARLEIGYPPLWAVRCRLTLMQQDHAATLECLKVMQDRLGQTIGDLRGDPRFKDFVASPQFDEWHAVWNPPGPQLDPSAPGGG